jgi:hypothetical protein
MSTRTELRKSRLRATVPLRRPFFVVDTLALCCTFVLATIGSAAAGFGVLTNCTDDFDCGASSCGPCRTASGWLIGGGVGQGVLFLAAATLIWVAVKRPARMSTYVTIAATILVLSPILIIVTTFVANNSY